MPRMTDDQHNLLREIVDGHAQVKEEFYYSTAGDGTTMQQPSVEGERAVDYPDIEQLSQLGFISLTPQEGLAMTGSLYPTGDGIHEVEERRRIESIVRTDGAISEGDRMGIGWDDTLPVLQAVVELYPDAPPGLGVLQARVNERLGRDEGDLDTSRKFEMLAEAGYVKGYLESDQVPGPLMAAPTEKALKLLKGWPADGAVALERLVVALEARIDASGDEEERGKLRSVLAAIQAVGQELAAEVMAKVILGG